MNLYRSFAGRPWAITQDAFEDIRAKVQATEFKSFDGLPDFFTTTPDLLEIRRNVAIIKISGVIVGELSLLDAIMGGATSLSGIRTALDQALASDVNAIVLHFDNCPGGVVSGTPPLATYIYEARQLSTKPILAFGSGMLCSAGVWLSSQCDSVSVSEDCSTGSIGVIAEIVSTDRANANQGVDVRVFRSSDRKFAGTGYQEVNGRDLQSQCLRFAGMFTDAFARGRGLDLATAQEVSDARIVIGSDALPIFADEVTTLDAIIQRYGSNA